MLVDDLHGQTIIGADPQATQDVRAQEDATTLEQTHQLLRIGAFSWLQDGTMPELEDLFVSATKELLSIL
jgi:hypothetical protein